MRLSLLHILLFLFTSSCLSSQTGDSEFIEKEMRRTMRKQHLPAMAVTVVSGQEVLYQDAIGLIDLEKQIPATIRSLFKLWSLAKSFTALGIFRGVEDGRSDRIPGGTWKSAGEARTDMQINEGILEMSGPYGPILPVNDTLIRVLSGSFHGELLDFNPETGVIFHQKWAFIPGNQ